MASVLPDCRILSVDRERCYVDESHQGSQWRRCSPILPKSPGQPPPSLRWDQVCGTYLQLSNQRLKHLLWRPHVARQGCRHGVFQCPEWPWHSGRSIIHSVLWRSKFLHGLFIVVKEVYHPLLRVMHLAKECSKNMRCRMLTFK